MTDPINLDRERQRKRLKQAIAQVFRQRDVLGADAVALIREFETRLAELDALETDTGASPGAVQARGAVPGKRMGEHLATPGGAFQQRAFPRVQQRVAPDRRRWRPTRDLITDLYKNAKIAERQAISMFGL
jgi:hypothetical protein